MSRPEPEPDALTEPFWQAVEQGVLAIQRCTACRTYFMPPEDYCTACGSTELDFEPVTGHGVIHSYTQTHSGARHPFFASITPYIVGVVELDEQPGLFMYTNFPGASVDDLEVGLPVTVEFDQTASMIPLPQFRVTAHYGEFRRSETS